MMRFPDLSIRTHLMLLVFLALLPALGVILFFALESREEVLKEAEQNSLHLAGDMAGEYERPIVAVRELVETFANMPCFRQRNLSECAARMQEPLVANPYFANIVLVDAPSGNMVISALPVPPPLPSAADRHYFKEVMRTGEFSAGEYVISRTTKLPVLHFGGPVRDDSGKIILVLSVALDLKYCNRIFEEARLPEGSVLALTDHAGTRLFRHPGNDRYAGQADMPEILNLMQKGEDEGTFRATGVDGVRRLYGYKKMRLGKGEAPYLFLRMGVPETLVLAATNRTLAIRLAFLALAVCGALAVAWLLGQYGIAMRLKRFVAASRRIAQGDLSARTGLAHGENELGQLARVFDKMAEELTRREKDRDRARAALLETEAQLRQAQKMEAVGTLAGGIAHDFNNLLTAILGCADVLVTESKPGSGAFEAASTIQKAAERASRLTHQLLDFARKGQLQKVPINLHAELEDAITLLSHTVDKNIVISKRFHAGSAWVLGDPNQVEQIFINLAVNARDAMPDGGEIIVATEAITVTEAEHGMEPDVAAGDYVAVSVSDTGCGIPEDIHARVFEPFFTTKEPGRGTGMGLATVYGVVKNHGGFVRLWSKPGEGTRFTVCLPASQQAAPSIPEPSSPGLQKGRGRILLVDDEEVVREMLSRLLTKLGYSVMTFGEGEAAVAYYREHAGEVDLVIVDMSMPGMDGRACFQAMKEIEPTVRVLLSSGYAHDQKIEQALEEGVAGFLPKPYHIKALAAEVARILEAVAVSGESAGY